MAVSCLYQLAIILFGFIYSYCANVEKFNLQSVSNGQQIELVCKITDIQADQWVAIYRYFSHYAQCLFWEQAEVENGPFTCTGDFQVTVSRPANNQVEYTILYDLPLSSSNTGDYFCRVLNDAGNDKFTLDSTALEFSNQNSPVREINGYTNKYPLCSPKTRMYTIGDSIDLTCSSLGKVPIEVEWKRNGKVMDGYPKIFHHGVDPGPSSNSSMEYYNRDGYILVTTRMTITLGEMDELTYFTCESSSPASSKQNCNIGPFQLEGSGSQAGPTPGNGTSVCSSLTVLGLDVWLFTTIVAGVIIGILIVVIIILSVCFYKAKKRAIYLLRHGSQHPIMAHEEAHELDDQNVNHAYDESRDPHEHNGGRPYTDVTIHDNVNDSESEFDDDFGPEHDAVYSNTNVLPDQARYGNTIQRSDRKQNHSIYQNH